MIDTHAHLDACAEPAGVLLARARAAGVERVIAIGSGIESCRAALAIAASQAGVSCALGIHPHQAGGDDAGKIDDLRALLADPGAVAVGEIGLDFYRDYAPRPAQRRLFEEQLALAAELELPVVVHTRAADEETADLLGAFDGTVVMHCFSSPELLRVVLERDYYVSFAGNVTFTKADALRDAARQIGAERILAETDCPYLAPQPVRGRANEPANVVYTVQALAAARGESTEELAARIDDNATRAFGLP